MNTEDLAKLVIHTVETRLASWNKEAFKCAEESEKRRWIEGGKDPEEHYWMYEDPSQFYDMTEEEAAVHSCKFLGLDTRLARLIDLSLHWWNDILWWAEDILDPSETEMAKALAQEVSDGYKTL